MASNLRILTRPTSESSPPRSLSPSLQHTQAIRKPCHFEIIDRLNQEALDDNNCKPLLPGEPPAAMDAEFAAVMDRCTAGLPLTTVPIGADTQGSARISPWPLYYDMKNYKYIDTYAVNHVPP
eukprot:365893-Chlamydomonas_euryale.AAC.1